MSIKHQHTVSAGPTTDRRAVELEYFISLDLGSESMAACFQHRDANLPTTIDLQARAEELRGWQEGMTPLDLLLEETGNGRRPAHRLRTRISLREKKQPSPLPDEHARLSFTGGYDMSIFNFFHLKGEALASEYLIPNPKLLFQTGITDVIPSVPGPEGPNVQYEPAELLAHLTVQVLNNLVLTAKELQVDAQHRRRPRFDARSAHLTITVPNVYSLTHIKRLEDFVRRHTDVGAIDTMYESDAIAHFMLGDLPGASPEVEVTRRRIAEALAQRRHDAGNCRVLTIDIGKGTTDLSLFNYDMNHQEGGSFTHDVLGRTGRSHGGARLSYIIVEHLEDRIRKTLEETKNNPQVPDLFKQAVVEKQPYVSLLVQPARASARGTILGAAENFVEVYKRGLDDQYQLDKKVKLEPLATALVEAICREIGTAEPIARLLLSADSAAGGAPSPEADGIRQAMKILQDKLKHAVAFPSQLPGGTSPSPRGLRLFGRKPASPAPSPAEIDPDFFKLRNSLDSYVRENVEEPLNWLVQMAEQRERWDRKPRGRRVDSENTFVVVAGQAAQFAPIRRAIREQASGSLGLDLETNLLFLPDKLAKLACSFGAQWYYRSALSCNNPEEIMGTYSFLRRFAATELVNLNMRTFNQKDAVQELSLMKGQYWLVFQSRAVDGEKVPLAEVNRDSMAFIRTFGFLGSGRVRVRYRGWGRAIEIAEGDRAFDPIEFEATFGNEGNDVDDVYRKTWPEAVPNVFKST